MNRFLISLVFFHICFATFSQIEDYRFWITKMAGGNGYGKISSVNADGSGYNNGVVFEGALDGKIPNPELLTGTDGKIYGTTYQGGMFDRGVVFSMNPDGSSYSVLYHFTIRSANVSNTLVEGQNGKLYGVCKGVASYPGIVFVLDRNTKHFEVIHEFKLESDGTRPSAIMIASNGLLYGVCEQTTGAGSNGTIFRIDLDSNNAFEKLTDTHGGSPGPLVEGTNGLLYGIAPNGGTAGAGEIHRINLDGLGYTNLFDFNSIGGRDPKNQIVEGPDGVFYGTCKLGTDAVVFKVRKDATDFTSLYTFLQSDGNTPVSGLILTSDGLLYGYLNAVYTGKRLYKVKTDGSGFQVLNAVPTTFSAQAVPFRTDDGSFFFCSISNPQSTNGSIQKRKLDNTTVIIKEFPESLDYPYQILHSRSNEIYGILREGGPLGYGGVFRLTKDGSHQLTTIFENNVTNSANFAYNLVEDEDGNFYSYTNGAGNVISKLTPAGVQQTIFQFPNGNFEWSTRSELFRASNGRLYGLSSGQGTNIKATLYSLNIDGTGYMNEHVLEQTTLPRQPIYFEFEGYLYGIVAGGSNNTGSIYRFHLTTKVFEIIYDLPSNIGINNFGYIKLAKGPDGMIYGNAATGGSGQGIVFKLAMDGSGFQVLRTFSSGEKKEWLPLRVVFGADARLYGITALGGANDVGVIFRMNLDGTDYQRVFELPEEQELRFLAEVDLNLIPKIPHVITFEPPAHTLKVGDNPIQLIATSDRGFPITFTSSNPDIAKIEGSKLTILCAGEVTVTAMQTANDFYTRSAVTHTFIIEKAEQVLAFGPISSTIVNADEFELIGTSSAGLPVSYSTTDDNINITGNKVKILSAGRATITADQQGDENHHAALSVEQSFCVNPLKPNISEERFHPTELLLTSSNDSGNQWYFNGIAIPGATDKSFIAKEDGSYTVKTTVRGCASEISDELLTIVTDVEISSQQNISMYPNPVTQQLAIDIAHTRQELTTISIIDSHGKTLLTRTSKNSREVFDLGSLRKGLYVVQVKRKNHVIMRRIVKK